MLFMLTPYATGDSEVHAQFGREGVEAKRPTLSDLLDAFVQTQPALTRAEFRDAEYIADWLEETVNEIPLVLDTLKRLPPHTQAALILAFADSILSSDSFSGPPVG